MTQGGGVLFEDSEVMGLRRVFVFSPNLLRELGLQITHFCTRNEPVEQTFSEYLELRWYKGK